MENIKSSLLPKVQYTTELATNLPDSAQFPQRLYSFLEKARNDDNNPLTIHALRVILVLISIVKKDQVFSTQQLDLFDEDWYATDKASHDQVQFFLKLKDLIPQGSKNYDYAKEGLKFLLKFVTEEKLIIKGKEVELHSSVISNLVFNDGDKGAKFYMHQYWYRIFIDISKGYNRIATNSIFNISSLHAYLFYLFLTTLRRSKQDAGSCEMRMDTINERFNTNYKYWSKIKEKILDPVKTSLDANSELSFNYSWPVEGNKITIVAYETAKIAPELKSDIDYRIDKAVRYKKSKHSLNDIQVGQLTGIYKKYSYDTVTAAISRKKELQNLKSDTYLKKLQEILYGYIEHKHKKQLATTA
ncbi:RepB family plasmid replication initiator protein [Flavobacterium sp. 17A]|uniref:RepB family plasmid replication initiator protein n=1 Tax=Flavobacterium potami TaxID=2872310 RepID=A0A9X1HFM9_9FLAO|nr:RepB family plasmid replication initiator protein [Flavobacterium potami]MBZ4037831.1 RepB family plasmid replication initiator protein [Flavobacterium potami]